MSDVAGATPDQVRACLLAVLTGDAGIAEDVLLTADCIADSRGLDADALREAGLTTAPAGASAGVVLRALPCALLNSNDRPAVRRSAHLAAAVAGVDEGTAVVAVAVGVLATDLIRGFPLDTALLRCHQTLLEEAPMALLNRLRPLADDAQLDGDGDPSMALQLAVTALHRAQGVDAVLAQFEGSPLHTAPPLAAALAAIRDGFDGFDIGLLSDHPLRNRAESAAAGLVGELATIDAS